MSTGDTAASPAAKALADAEPTVYWTDRASVPESHPPLAGRGSADLVVVGGGLTGLWAAILAKQRRPADDVVLLEARSVAFGGSGRNGGFLSETLTHGLAHGQQCWPGELELLVNLGRQNLREIAQFVREEGIDADLRLCGRTHVATEAHQVGELRAEADRYEQHGVHAVFQGAGGVQADIHSPTYRAGLRIADAGGLVDPAGLTRGLAAAAARRGVRIHEDSEVTSIRSGRDHVELNTPRGTLRSPRVVLATSAFPVPLRRIRRYVLPVWDYVLVTEPLSDSQWEAVGWHDRQGMVDAGNLFHYYRPTRDGRVLWGGYEAVYYFGGRTDAALMRRHRSHELLARNFFRTFPQLEGVRFTHRWGGPIDSTTRFTPVFGTACAGTVAYAAGYTGLGVAASRFGAEVALDLVLGEDTERTRLGMVRGKPPPFPPEPLRWLVVRYTQHALAQADQRQGERGWWLRWLDSKGLGFG